MNASLISALAPAGDVLYVVAAPAEAEAVIGARGGATPKPWSRATLGDRAHLLCSGVGKANAAGAVAAELARGGVSSVVNLGVGGALPGSDLAIGSVVVGARSVFADEGVITPDGFSDVAEMGFPPTDDGISIAADERLLALASGCGAAGAIATVSTCSGTDAAATAVVERTEAVVEAMEGAAVGVACRRMGVGFLEVRVVSNTTGDRDGQIWDLPGALDRLSALMVGMPS